MKARQDNATDPPTEEHELTDGSGEWVRIRRQTVKDIVEWTGPEEFLGETFCGACGEAAGSGEPREHADDCWWVELSRALGLPP